MDSLDLLIQRQKTVGDVPGALGKPSRLCPACRRLRFLNEFHSIPKTPLTDNVRDILCSDCVRSRPRESAELVRIVCLGCREVMTIREPWKDRSGFEAVKGDCLHVPHCPICLPGCRSAPLLEQKAFYKLRKLL
jgi:hypothetical protein